MCDQREYKRTKGEWEWEMKWILTAVGYGYDALDCITFDVSQCIINPISNFISIYIIPKSSQKKGTIQSEQKQNGEEF